MQQFNFPTTLLYGEGSLANSAKKIKALGLKKPLLVTDKTLVDLGITDLVLDELKKQNIQPIIFDETHSNPTEDDCINGSRVYKKNGCDSVIALGGGSPIDAAKGIMVLASNDGDLEKYDDAKDGGKYILNPLPLLIAIPTTAGTGSEVGQSGVIIIKKTNTKTIISHPDMMPKLAVLEPTLTTGLPKHITAATGIDAFIHSLEAYFAPTFHPMADGIALEGMKLILDNLEIACNDDTNIEARSKMLLAASMGATAFQKGLGMIHSIAHPLSSECGLHHGLANALVTPMCISFLENSNLGQDQKSKILDVLGLFRKRGMAHKTLSLTCSAYFKKLGINFGLTSHGVKESQIQILSEKATLDSCHQTNMVPVTMDNFKAVISEAM